MQGPRFMGPQGPGHRQRHAFGEGQLARRGPLPSPAADSGGGRCAESPSRRCGSPVRSSPTTNRPFLTRRPVSTASGQESATVNLLFMDFPCIPVGVLAICGQDWPFSLFFRQIHPSNKDFESARAGCICLKNPENSMSLHSSESFAYIAPMAAIFPKIFRFFPDSCRSLPVFSRFFQSLPKIAT